MIMEHEVHPGLLTVFSALPGFDFSSVESIRKVIEQMHKSANPCVVFSEYSIPGFQVDS
jgi:hypothetical protein